MIVVVIMVALAIAAPDRVRHALVHHPVDIAYPDAGEDLNGQPSYTPGVNGFWLGADGRAVT